MTNAPLEIYPEPMWEILDPNSAQVVALFHDEAAAQEYLEWRNSRRGCEGCNAEAAEPCRWGCLSSVPLDCLIEAIEMWVDRPKKKSELIEIGNYLAKVASDYLCSTGATPVAPIIPDSKDN
jgi:hypothetical protein